MRGNLKNWEWSENTNKEFCKNCTCPRNNKKGICVIKKSKQSEWKERLNTLEETINYWINSDNITNKTVEIIQLFYDKWINKIIYHQSHGGLRHNGHTLLQTVLLLL